VGIKEAIDIDKILDSDDIPEKYSLENAPLLGVPFSCKESFWVKGMPNSTGIIDRKDYRAPGDADVVKYMKEAGGILTCLTNTSEVI
jgi:Asp-tRNA(Asn)/Glu-tRNA(Gln) amidotransferase A subunit family amidase